MSVTYNLLPLALPFFHVGLCDRVTWHMFTPPPVDLLPLGGLAPVGQPPETPGRMNGQDRLHGQAARYNAGYFNDH